MVGPRSIRSHSKSDDLLTLSFLEFYILCLADHQRQCLSLLIIVTQSSACVVRFIIGCLSRPCRNLRITTTLSAEQLFEQPIPYSNLPHHSSRAPIQLLLPEFLPANARGSYLRSVPGFPATSGRGWCTSRAARGLLWRLSGVSQAAQS